MKPERKYDLNDRLIDYSVLIIELVKTLPNDLMTQHLGKQLLRSGTSPSLNYGEAQAAESKRDFVHKLKIGLKELRESFNNIKILERANYISMDSRVKTEQMN